MKKSWLWEDYKIDLFMIVRGNKLYIENKSNNLNDCAEIDILDRKDCGITVSLRKLLSALRKIDANDSENLLKQHGFQPVSREDMEDNLFWNILAIEESEEKS